MCFLSDRQPPFQAWLSGVLLLLGVATASCHSAKVAYQFHPVNSPTAARPEAPAGPLLGGSFGRQTSTVAAARVSTNQFASQRERPHGRARHRSTRAVAGQPALRFRVVGQAAAQVARRPIVAPRNTAEVGLGTTVLGLLGLLALPIGLIGLLLGGGLVWGILAAAGALAVLVAWLDPFG